MAIQTSVMQFFADQCNNGLGSLARERAEELLAQPVSQRIKMLLRWRLEMLIPYIGAFGGRGFVLGNGQWVLVSAFLTSQPFAAFFG